MADCKIQGALFAACASPLVLADRCTAALFALCASPLVLTHRCTAALVAGCAVPLVLAIRSTAALFALCASLVVLAPPTVPPPYPIAYHIRSASFDPVHFAHDAIRLRRGYFHRCRTQRLPCIWSGGRARYARALVACTGALDLRENSTYCSRSVAKLYQLLLKL